MINYNKINKKFRLPSEYADYLGHKILSRRVAAGRKKTGQYFTTPEIAKFMASLSEKEDEFIRILDCGSGTAILSCALVENIIINKKSIKSLEIVAVEKDTYLSSQCNLVLEFLKMWSLEFNVKLNYKIINYDFTEFSNIIDDNNNSVMFDIAISNPPYLKLNKTNTIMDNYGAIVHGQPNIYVLFLAKAASLLKNGGELIFITPRSFTSGSYFKLFRKYFFSLIQISLIHIFDSRKDIFNRDKILQENIILRGKRTAINGYNPQVRISSSSGSKDLSNKSEVVTTLKSIINFDSEQQILHMPTSYEDIKILELFKLWEGNFKKYNINISTGPVVPFRKSNLLVKENYKYSKVPLIWLHNTKKMKLDLSSPKTGKPQFIKAGKKSLSVLVPNKNYVLVRRFSSKDDKRRLVAVPLFRKKINYDFIGIENHLNYIYKSNSEFQEDEITGISTLLNSKIYDVYFRSFNGNTNVSATELKELPLPEYNIIRELGTKVIANEVLSEDDINKIILKEYYENEQN